MAVSYSEIIENASKSFFLRFQIDDFSTESSHEFFYNGQK